MQSIHADEQQDLDQVLEKLSEYEDHNSVYRLRPDFTDSGDALLQTDSYNVIITPDNIQVKGVDTTDTNFLDLEEGEEQALDYLRGKYEGSNGTTRNAR